MMRACRHHADRAERVCAAISHARFQAMMEGAQGLAEQLHALEIRAARELRGAELAATEFEGMEP